MTTKISYAIAFLLGLAMIFLGARFFSILKQQLLHSAFALTPMGITPFITSRVSGIYSPGSCCALWF